MAIYYRIKQHLGYITLWWLFIWAIIDTIIGNKMFFAIGILFMVCSTVWLFVLWIKSTSKLKQFRNADTLWYERKPTPGISMLLSLKKMGYPIEHIYSIKMMTYDLKDVYMRGFVNKVKSAKIKISVCGNGDKNEKEEDAVYVSTSVLLKEHINIINTKDQNVFVWYEPTHVIINKKHYLPDGAFLLKIPTNDSDSINELYSKKCLLQ